MIDAETMQLAYQCLDWNSWKSSVEMFSIQLIGHPGFDSMMAIHGPSAFNVCEGPEAFVERIYQLIP